MQGKDVSTGQCPRGLIDRLYVGGALNLSLASGGFSTTSVLWKNVNLRKTKRLQTRGS